MKRNIRGVRYIEWIINAICVVSLLVYIVLFFLSKYSAAIPWAIMLATFEIINTGFRVVRYIRQTPKPSRWNVINHCMLALCCMINAHGIFVLEQTIRALS